MRFLSSAGCAGQLCAPFWLHFARVRAIILTKIFTDGQVVFYAGSFTADGRAERLSRDILHRIQCGGQRAGIPQSARFLRTGRTRAVGARAAGQILRRAERERRDRFYGRRRREGIQDRGEPYRLALPQTQRERRALGRDVHAPEYGAVRRRALVHLLRPPAPPCRTHGVRRGRRARLAPVCKRLHRFAPLPRHTPQPRRKRKVCAQSAGKPAPSDPGRETAGRAARQPRLLRSVRRMRGKALFLGCGKRIFLCAAAG